MDPDDFNVPEKILVELESEKPKIRRGYPERLDKGRLWGVRQHLLVLLRQLGTRSDAFFQELKQWRN